ncbi:Mob1/phocein [Melanomma pulvis-pyrius CBS 109.77]|uniref:Mob1/phocein n=1 Tax=Melanomma pulvis-pyrius CBS 109.77 TaxID=1314802 RepID=A0A6A6WNY8_9PLEO|nr:Mob1/phocein [Melanomma pulvis-pyrius CBS 109.77]
MAASALSPSSSPRLPSPPPIAEDQLGPKSPLPATEEQQKLFSNLDHGAARRIRPGTKADDMAEGPPLVDLSEIDSAFQLTEHLKALHNFLTHPIGANTTLAVDREMAHRLAHPPENIDNTLWLYELCRFLTQKVNSIIIALFSDNPPCSSVTCPEMRASEWQYLCAVHDPPKSCCAIDYCCHTLDWAANTLTSPKNFPSRLALGTDGSTQHAQMRHLTTIFRRVYRIFAHAWFQHREMFWKVETRTGLYVFFKAVCDVYGLIPEDNYTIPSEAEGVEVSKEAAAPPLILKRTPSGPGAHDSDNSSTIEGTDDHSLSTAGTTVRHRHSPSVGATAVSTVVEEAEEEEEPLAKEESEAQEPHADADAEISKAGDEDDVTGLVEPLVIGEKVDAIEASAPPAEADDSHTTTDSAGKERASDGEAVDPEADIEEQESEALEEATPAIEIKDGEDMEVEEKGEAKGEANGEAKGEEKAEAKAEAEEVEEMEEDEEGEEVEAEAEAEAEVEAEESPAVEPEKAEKDEAIGDGDKSRSVKEQGEKAGSAE